MIYEPELETGNPVDRTTECLIYPIFKNDSDEPRLDELPDLPENRLDDFEADPGQTQLFYEGNFAAERLLLFGCGKAGELETSELTELGGKITGATESFDVCEATVVFPLEIGQDREEAAAKFSTGLSLGGYEFDHFKHEENDEEDESGDELEEITLLLDDARSRPTVARGNDRGQKLARAVKMTRDLCNTPANELNPADLEARARELAEDATRVELKVYGDEKLAEQDFGLIRSVGRGSETPPRLLQLDYQPEQPKDTVVLAGKGVTFDSGGISLKPSKNMGEMKFDMGGAAIVLGVLRAANSLDLPVRVVGLVPAVENMPDSRSTRPGDVVTGYGGKSVEILNTDAEGRLILADTLSYAGEKWGEEADLLLDYATLTGSCIVCLGHAGAGLMGNDDGLCDQLVAAGRETDERLWRLPLWDEFEEKLESEIGDIKNVGGRAGTSIAATFLREFVDEDQFDSWAHLDVAGTAWGMKSKSYRPEGGTGFGVRLTVKLLRQRYALDN